MNMIASTTSAPVPRYRKPRRSRLRPPSDVSVDWLDR
jgi:hypothetical protein